MFYNICYYTTRIKCEWGNSLKKLSNKQKQFLLAKSKKEMRKRIKKNRQKKLKIKIENSQEYYKTIKQAYIEKRVKAPIILSVFDNCSETLGFFAEVSKTISSLNVSGKIYFDLSDVEQVSVDAIMYLIAIITNTKRIRSLKINCAGNIPKNSEARKTLENCGFYKYVSPQYQIKDKSSTDHINITRGKEADPILSREICDFVHQHSKNDRISTKSLYTMIMELMANTKQHAYNGDENMQNNWYVFVEDTSSFLHFIFLDTGSGIPNTVRKKSLFEKIKNKMNLDDAFFIAEALTGVELRSETNLNYRGKGLHEIYNRVLTDYISDFSIISGFGKCSVSSEGKIEKTKLSSNLTGTMLCWKLLKKEE